MRIALIHNRYRLPGGEDSVFVEEQALLKINGHSVLDHTVDNSSIADSIVGRVKTAVVTVWNHKAYWELRQLFREGKPDVAHFHNFFPLLSPAAYYAARAEGVPVIQTLHNYRLTCPSALLFRNGHPCEECLGKAFPWAGIVHKCYRNSRAASAVVASMIASHRALGTWINKVDLYLALTDFARKKHIQGGLPPDQVFVKPNFVYPDPGVGEHQGKYALFVGRLSAEKGLDILLDSWQLLRGRFTLVIAGRGPLEPVIREATARIPGVRWLGPRPAEEIRKVMGNALILILPSRWYETFGRVAIEAFAKGTPVIASNIGATAELVCDGRTGLLFRSRDARDLAAKIEWAFRHEEQVRLMGREARVEYETKYTAGINYRKLMEMYELAIDHARKRG